MEQEHQPSYVAYEYKEIEAKGERAALLMDCYQSLGWEAEKETASGKIMLRRSRKIINKAELTRLQRNLEACVAEIDALQKSKTSKAAITSLVIGLVGTAFMAGSVFAVTATPPVIWLCILLAVPAFTLWALAPILYPRMVAGQQTAVNLLASHDLGCIPEPGYGLFFFCNFNAAETQRKQFPNTRMLD